MLKISNLYNYVYFVNLCVRGLYSKQLGLSKKTHHLAVFTLRPLRLQVSCELARNEKFDHVALESRDGTAQYHWLSDRGSTCVLRDEPSSLFQFQYNIRGSSFRQDTIRYSTEMIMKTKTIFKSRIMRCSTRLEMTITSY